MPEKKIKRMVIQILDLRKEWINEELQQRERTCKTESVRDGELNRGNKQTRRREPAADQGRRKASAIWKTGQRKAAKPNSKKRKNNK